MLNCRVLLHISLLSLIIGIQAEAAPESQKNSVKPDSNITLTDPSKVKKGTKPQSSKKKKKKSVAVSAVSQPSRPKEERNTKPLLNKSALNTPQWLRIDHDRFTRPKAGLLPLNDQHPFKKALVSAYNTNPKIKSELRKYYAIAEEVSKATAGWRPDVGATLSGGYVKTENYDPNTGGKITSSVNQRSAAAQIKQNLYQGGGTISATEAAENRLRASRASFLNTEQIILLNAIQAYLKLWSARENLNITKNSGEFYRESLAQAQAQLEVGESSITDVATARFNYQTTEARRRAAQADIQNAESAYIQAIGEQPPALLMLPPSAENIMEIPKDLNLFLQNADLYNPGVINSQYTHLATKNDIDTANAALLPSVDLVGSADRLLSQRSRGSRQNDMSVVLQLNIPLYSNGGRNWASSRQNEQTAVQTKHDVRTAKQQARYDANRTWELINSNRTQIKELEQAMEAGYQSVEGARQEYLVGERPQIEVFQVRSTLDSALRSLVQAQFDYTYTSYEMLSVIGELTPETLNLAVNTYDLNTYPEAVRYKWIGWEQAPSDRRKG